MKHAVEVGLQRPVEMLLGQVFEPIDVKLESSIIHQHIHATELLDDLRDGILAKGAVSDVARDQQAFFALVRDDEAGLFGVFVFGEVDGVFARAGLWRLFLLRWRFFRVDFRLDLPLSDAPSAPETEYRSKRV